MGGYRSYANRGRAFENYLKLAHERYQREGIACVHKVPTEFLPLRNASGQIFSCKVEEKSCVDYLGRYREVPVAVEAKHTERERISFSEVQPHQADYLDDWCRDPAAVGLVVVSFGMRRFFAVPWPFWRVARTMWQKSKHESCAVNAYGWVWMTPGMASVAPQQLHPDWEIRAGGPVGLPYLEVIERMKTE